MPSAVILLLFTCVDWYNYVNADQNSDRSNNTSETYGNKLSSATSSSDGNIDEEYNQHNETNSYDLEEYGSDVMRYPIITLYTYDNGIVTSHTRDIFENEEICMDNVYRNITLPPGVHRFLVKNVSCIVYNILHLNCSWAMVNVPEGAQYSVTVNQDGSLLPCHCSMNNEAGVVKCNGEIVDGPYFTININVTVTNFQYVHSQEFEQLEIEKLNSPHNVTASVISGNLYIDWDLKSKVKGVKCYNFQLRIKSHIEDIMEISAQKSFTIPNIDQTQSYKIQIRVTKNGRCRENGIWSDWSEPVVVNPHKKPLELNVLRICGISLGFPMCLLAVLLLCRHPRMLRKFFPPIPTPSVKIQQLLEKDDFIEVMQFKYLEEITKVEDDSG